jgi:8-oxo-dGTP diphosphatase
MCGPECGDDDLRGREIRTATFEMQIWLVETWTGTPVNAAPAEHDTVAWFETPDLDGLRLAHESYLPTLTAVLARCVGSA